MILLLVSVLSHQHRHDHDHFFTLFLLLLFCCCCLFIINLLPAITSGSTDAASGVFPFLFSISLYLKLLTAHHLAKINMATDPATTPSCTHLFISILLSTIVLATATRIIPKRNIKREFDRVRSAPLHCRTAMAIWELKHMSQILRKPAMQKKPPAEGWRV